MQLYGSHIWLLRGLEALSKTAPLIQEPPDTECFRFLWNFLLVLADSFASVLCFTHPCVRFLARASEQCAAVRNGWWGATAAMKESQVYPRSFGRAVLWSLIQKWSLVSGTLFF